MPFLPPGGTLIIPPFTCTNVTIQVGRPTNGLPVGAVVRWTLSVMPADACPIACIGSVINPGPVIVRLPEDPVAIPGTRIGTTVRISLTGLASGAPVRVRAIGPDMEPDTQAVSLNGLPPGTPVIVSAAGQLAAAPGELNLDLGVRFVEADPVGAYPILVETDLDGDGEFDTVSSFDAENPVVTPPTLVIVRGANGLSLDWNDEGDGVLQAADSFDGPWTSIAGARRGYVIVPSAKTMFFRVSVPSE